MDLFTVMAMAGLSALPSLMGGGSEPPGMPKPQYPDADLLNEFRMTNDWTNMLRSQMTADFYGGTASYPGLNAPQDPNDAESEKFLQTLYGDPASGVGLEDYGMEDLTPSQQASIKASNVPIPKGRWEATYTGAKPAARYLAGQNKIYNESAANFGNEMSDYLKSRGIEDGGTVAGAQSELKQDYEQKAREVASKSNDIYMQTLANLFGEVSDYGGQAAQLSGLTGQASQQWGADMDRRYQQQMAMWQQAQSQPPNPWAQAAGTMLPYLFMGSGGTKYYDV